MKKDLVEVFITVSAWATYLMLVLNHTANIEGFVAVNLYIIKKALDIREEAAKNDGK